MSKKVKRSRCLGPEKFIVYGLIDLRNSQLRYVGKSTTGFYRVLSHFAPSNLSAKTHKNAWLKTMLKDGLKFTPQNISDFCIVFESFPTGAELQEAEQFWIAYMRAIGANLTNATSGGEGCLGRVFSEESKRKLSVKLKAANQNSELYKLNSERLRKITRDEGWKKQTSLRVSKDMRNSPERRKRSGDILRALWKDPAFRDRSRLRDSKPITDQHGIIYYSITAAAAILGINRSSIKRVLNGRFKQAKGYRFTYLEEGRHGPQRA